LTLDRNDALNSAVANERDLGAFFYWAPSKEERFLQCSLKMDTRVQVIMVYLHLEYNGQTSNRTEGNKNARGNQSKLSVCHRQSDHRAVFKHIQVNGLWKNLCVC
jgi:hypothetical protein